MIVLDVQRWAPCFGGLYAVSSSGAVRRISGYQRCGKYRDPKPGNLALFPSGRGKYLAVSLCKEGRRKVVEVHRLVSEAFLGRCPIGKEVNHINGDGTDNRVENLEYVTRSENMRHAYRMGLATPRRMDGENNPRARLSSQQVAEIMEMRGRVSARSLAPKYGVARSTIQAVWDGQSWRSE